MIKTFGNTARNAIACLIVALTLWTVSWNNVLSSFQIGVDEGVELAKAKAIVEGHKLYSEVWSDQPPLFTYILASAFRHSQSPVLSARIIALICGTVFMLTGYCFAIQISKSTTIAVLTVFLAFIAAPEFLRMASTPMLEIPAFALGGVAWMLAKLKPHSRGTRLCVLIASATAMGGALSMKFTSVLLIPSILVAIYQKEGCAERVSVLSTLTTFVCYMCVALLIPIAIIKCSGASLQSMVFAHGSFNSIDGIPSPEKFSPTMGAPSLHAGAIVMLAVGLLSLPNLVRTSEYADAIIGLSVVIAIHTMYRPYWPFYYVHYLLFATPIVALGIKKTCELWRNNRLNQLAVTGLVLFVMISFVHGTFESLRQLYRAARVDEIPTIEIASQLAKSGKRCIQ